VAAERTFGSGVSIAGCNVTLPASNYFINAVNDLGEGFASFEVVGDVGGSLFDAGMALEEFAQGVYRGEGFARAILSCEPGGDDFSRFHREEKVRGMRYEVLSR